MQQQLPVADGWYRLIVYSSLPASGVLGDDQVIEINMEPMGSMPQRRWEGVPLLCQ